MVNQRGIIVEIGVIDGKNVKVIQFGLHLRLSHESPLCLLDERRCWRTSGEGSKTFMAAVR
jgi:hypothetical protein